MYALQGLHEQARLCYHRAVAINPKFFLAHYNLGVLSEALGQYDLALSSYKTAAEINPHYEQARTNLQKLELRLAALKKASTP